MTVEVIVEMSAIVTKQVHLPADCAERLERLAQGRGMSEDALLEKALSLLFQLAEATDEADDPRAWQALGLSAFERDWDNEEDAIYDDWRKHYGVTS